MITIKESHLRFNIELNKLNASYGKAFTTYEIDILLNQGQMAFLAEKLGNKQGNGVEYDNVIMNQLSPILIHKQAITPTGNAVKSSALTANGVYRFISYQVRAEHNDCVKTFRECDFQKHQDILDVTQESNWKWGICNAYIVGTALEKSIKFEPNNEFVIQTAYISYYKYPSIVTIGGYTDVNGDILTTVEWDWTDDDTIMQIIKKAAILALEMIQPTIETKNAVSKMFD